jgi:BON domain
MSYLNSITIVGFVGADPEQGSPASCRPATKENPQAASKQTLDSGRALLRNEGNITCARGKRPPQRRHAASKKLHFREMELVMRRTTVASLMFFAMVTFAVSCSRLRSDDAIATDIKARMFSDPSLKSANINIAVKDGIVTLSGEVTNDGTRLTAEELAKAIKGVKRVDDQIVAGAVPATPLNVAENPPAASKPARPNSRHKHPAARSESAQSATSTPNPSERQTHAPAPVESAQDSPPAAVPAAPAPPPPPPPQPKTVTVPARTVLTVRTIDSIDSKTNQAGEVFRASLDAPIVVNNEVIVPAGADAYIKLVTASSAGRFAGRNELTLELSTVTFGGKTYNVVTSDVRQSGASRGKGSAEKIGGGAALGALIGAIAGGGKGAAIGAAVGGAGGAGLQGLRKGKDLKIPSETRLDFTLQQPFDITYIPRAR